ncbi:hypothetical protein HUU05_08765 [candidate division KSB1 bacterium]|nr:hypothetical protein [candidate division KSB1 bacterium]
MHESTKIDAAQHNGRGYETSDANVGGVAKFGVALAVICAIALVLMVLLLDYFRAEKKSAEPAMSPLAAQREALPPEPRLQIQPNADWEKYEASEDSVLNSYGWVSREAGVVRLPIDRALELVAQRGLPARAPSAEGGEQSARGEKLP